MATIASATEQRDRAWRLAATVLDPEVPVLTIEDLGVLRDVRIEGETTVVTLTPTYSGCPATSIINLDIETALRALARNDPVVLATDEIVSPTFVPDLIESP